MHAAAEAAVQDLAALLLGDRGGGQKLHEAGLLREAGLQYAELVQNALGKSFVPGKLIKSLSINIGCVCHNTSPRLFRKSSISFSSRSHMGFAWQHSVREQAAAP